MVKVAATYENYLELRDYLVYNKTNGMIYFKKDIGKFTKAHHSKNWMTTEARLTFEEFQEYYDTILQMTLTNAVNLY